MTTPAATTPPAAPAPAKKKNLTALQERVAQAEATLNALKAENHLAPNTPTPEAVFGAPHARKGENPLTSRGYSLLKLVKACVNPMQASDPWEDSKVERDVHRAFKGAFNHGFGSATFEGGMLAPFGSSLLPSELTGQFSEEIKGILAAGVAKADPDEMFHVGKRMGLMDLNMHTKASAQSWLDITLGGALVGPPQFGEPIELWRNRDALVRAGATVAPMPPSGRFVAPRQTNASTAYWGGEGASNTATNIKTGQITWTAKKLIALLVYNREILQFGGAAAEMLFRMDLTRSLTLGADFAFLESAGSDVKPLGIINTPNINVVAPTTAATGNAGALLAPQDLYSFNSAIEEANIPDDGGASFIMRPAMYYALLKRRTDAITAADAAGVFVFSPFRQLGDPMNNKNINGQKVITTTQVNNNRVQGNNSALTYIVYGYWPDYMILMSPLMEFVIASQGNPAGLGDLFQQDQFCLKSLLFCDGAARHPGGFAWCDKLQIA